MNTAAHNPAAEQRVAEGRYCVVKLAAFFRPLLARMRFVMTSDVETAGTTAKAICYVNPAFISAQNAKQAAFVVAHEAMHLWLRHHQRTSHYGADHHRANVAQDMTINPGLLAMGFQSPTLDGKPCCLLPSDIQAPENLSWEEYYTLAQAKEKQSKPQSGNGSQAPQSGNGSPQPGQGNPNGKPRGVGSGHCGSCSTGKAEPGQADPSDAPTDGEIERAAKAVSQAMVDAERSKRGSVPAGFLRVANAMLTPPQVRWNTKLRAAVQSTLRAVATGGVHSTYNAVSRRQHGIGYGPGLPVLPTYRAPKPRVAIVLDTSGSMRAADTSKALSEIAAIVKLTECTFIACDAAVHGKPQTVKRFRDLIPLIKGGGGSSFVPAFEALKANPCDIVIFLTDGDITVPSSNPLPPTTKVFWACINQGHGSHAPTDAYGVTLKID